MESLEDIILLRREIDSCDQELTQLFCRRLDISSRMAQCKQALGLPVRDEERERELLERVAELAGPEYGHSVRALYAAILSLSRARQRQLGAGEAKTASGGDGEAALSSGFGYLLSRAGILARGQKALVLGCGELASWAAAALEAAGAAEIALADPADPALSQGGREADILVNASSIGAYPQTDALPLDLDNCPGLSAVIDLVCNPSRTRLLYEAEKRGLVIANGLPMAAARALAAAGLSLEGPRGQADMESLLGQMVWATENIILIGMPGCGKTSLGRAIAHKLGRPLLDIDGMIERAVGRDIPRIFAEDGEEYFRRVEHMAVDACGRRSGCVVATGGGVVTRQENYWPLHANGIIVFMECDISALSPEGRPLSLKWGVERLYRERLPLYRGFADITLDMLEDKQETAEQVIAAVRRSIHGPAAPGFSRP